VTDAGPLCCSECGATYRPGAATHCRDCGALLGPCVPPPEPIAIPLTDDLALVREDVSHEVRRLVELLTEARIPHHVRSVDGTAPWTYDAERSAPRSHELYVRPDDLARVRALERTLPGTLSDELPEGVATPDLASVPDLLPPEVVAERDATALAKNRRWIGGALLVIGVLSGFRNGGRLDVLALVLVIAGVALLASGKPPSLRR